MPENNLARLLQRFSHTALSHAAALDRLDAAAADRSAAILTRLFQAIIAHGIDGRERLLGLLDSDRPVVAGMAAVYSLRYNPGRCRPVLASLARQPGLLGFRAAAALDRWDNGEWDLD
jgi:hypothetical protein